MIFNDSLEYVDSSIDAKSRKMRFFTKMKQNGYDFFDVDAVSRLPKFLSPVLAQEPVAFAKFNLLLMKLHRTKQVNILDAVSILVEDYLDASRVLRCLDEMSQSALIVELKKKYRLNKGLNQEITILDFLE